MSFLQMIRRLCGPISRCADFIRPIALAHFTSAAVVFAWPTISSISATPLGKEQDRAKIVAQIRSILSAQQNAWNRGDIDGFMNGYARSRSTIFVSEERRKTRLGNGPRTLQEEIPRSRENGSARFF